MTDPIATAIDYTPTIDVVRHAVTFPRLRLGEPRHMTPEAFERWLAGVRLAAASDARAAVAAEIAEWVGFDSTLDDGLNRAVGIAAPASDTAREATAHQCEAWQMQDSAKGGKYCAACGDDYPDGFPGVRTPGTEREAAARAAHGPNDGDGSTCGVCLAKVDAAPPAPPVVDDAAIEREALRQFPDAPYMDDRDQVRLGFEAGAEWAIARLTTEGTGS